MFVVSDCSSMRALVPKIVRSLRYWDCSNSLAVCFLLRVVSPCHFRRTSFDGSLDFKPIVSLRYNNQNIVHACNNRTMVYY